MTVASLAVATLRELAVLAKPTRVERDAAIQRFEYSFEATWKAAQRFLQIVEGIEVGSPKADDRNLTAHTYNERIAVAIFGRLPRHLATLEAWLRTMTARMPACR